MLWLLVVLLGMVVLAWSAPASSAMQHLADREEELRAAYAQQPALVLLVIGGLYVLLTALPLPGAALATLLTGWLCGFWPALMLVSFASTTAACLTFLSCRFLLGPASETPFLRRLHDLSPAECVPILFWLRLTPVLPFFAANGAMAATRITLTRFWIVSQMAMLPITAIYVSAGSRFPHLSELIEHGPAGILSVELLCWLGVLGGLPLLLQWLGRRWQASRIPRHGLSRND